jgi:hypothetical protein
MTKRLTKERRRGYPEANNLARLADRIIFFEEYGAVDEFERKLEKAAPHLLAEFREVLKIVADAGAAAEKYDTSNIKSPRAGKGKVGAKEKRVRYVSELMNALIKAEPKCKEGDQDDICDRIETDLLKICAKMKITAPSRDTTKRIIGALRAGRVVVTPTEVVFIASK